MKESLSGTDNGNTGGESTDGCLGMVSTRGSICCDNKPDRPNLTALGPAVDTSGSTDLEGVSKVVGPGMPADVPRAELGSGEAVDVFSGTRLSSLEGVRCVPMSLLDGVVGVAGNLSRSDCLPASDGSAKRGVPNTLRPALASSAKVGAIDGVVGVAGNSSRSDRLPASDESACGVPIKLPPALSSPAKAFAIDGIAGVGSQGSVIIAESTIETLDIDT